MRMLVSHGTVFPMTEANRVLEGADVYIENGVIVAVDPREPPFPSASIDKLLDASGCYVLPGFVNGHGHLGLGIYRGLGEFVPGHSWKTRFVREGLVAKHLVDEDYFLAAQLLIAEMMRAGVTSFADIHQQPPGAINVTDLVAQAVEMTGMRAVLSLEASGYLSLGETRLRYHQEEVDRSLRASCEFARKWHGRGRGQITVMLGLAAPPVPRRYEMEQVARAAKEMDLGIQMHVAEIAYEMVEWQNVYGSRPPRLLLETGILDRHVLGGNVVFLNAEDAAVLRDHPFHASACPKNCCKMALGMLDIPLMLESGVNVCLGSNEVVANNNQDMIEEMRFAALYHKMRRGNPSLLWGDEPLRLITERSGRALCTGAGVLDTGRPADLIIVEAVGPHMHPAHDAISNLIYAASSADTRTVVIAGNVVMEDRHILGFDERGTIERLEDRLAPLRSTLPALRAGPERANFEIRWEVEG